MKYFFYTPFNLFFILSLISSWGIRVPLVQAQGHSLNLCNELFLKNPIENPSIDLVTSPQLDELVNYLSLQIDRVLEFSYIQRLAKKQGIRVWLFGGTAASYLHYVRWDLARIQGLAPLKPERFDYDFTNIFRSTQDIDLVIDGSSKEAREFEFALAQRFPHFLGEKINHWEVRTLYQVIDSPGLPTYKEALLDDADFQNQNTDSQSIGMIEITSPPSGEARVRDLRSWNQFPGIFLKDTATGVIHFMRSKTHFETSRAKLGQNPEILSVLRALVKAFQFDLKFSADDLEEMKKIINHFEPENLVEPIARKRVIDTAKKLVFHAINLETAFDQMNELGLRSKLIQLENSSVEGALTWWLNREPLKSFSLGQGSGKTARELGITIVSHETKDFLAMESITRTNAGEPNAFISRSDVIGESAVYGDGFYTTIGRISSRGTGMTIRFQVHPGARQGSDFDIEKNAKDMVIFKNKKALEILPESLEFSLDDLLELTEKERALEIEKHDQGLFEKYLKRLNAARISDELDQLLNSSSDFEFEKGLKLLEAFKNTRLSSIISEEIRNAVIKSSFQILGNIPSGSREQRVVQLIQKNHFFREKKDILDLLVHARKNKTIRTALMEIYGDETIKNLHPIIHEIINEADLSPEVASNLIKTMEKIFINQIRGRSFDIEKELFTVKRLTEKSRIGRSLVDGVLVAYSYDEARLGHELWHSLDSTHSTLREAVLSLLSHPRIHSLSTVRALQEIVEIFLRHSSSIDFNSATQLWMQLSSTSAQLKASFLMSHFGYPEFKQFYSLIPAEQLSQVKKICLETRGLGAFKSLSIQEGIGFGKRESFIFQPRIFPKEGKRVTLGTSDQSLAFLAQGASHLAQYDVILSRYFEVQATPVTQLQWALVMLENPSFFIEGGEWVKIKNKTILMNPNHPVERVSWVDIQIFIEKLNQLDPDYVYRLPTEAEWEYSARDARISSMIKNANEVAWYFSNSEMKTHEVASQHALPSGIYDSYGNVWEWVKDGFSRRTPRELSIDPMGSTFGLDRVVRGGAYNSGKYFIDGPGYTLRDRKYTKFRDQTIGFRLVRTPKNLSNNQGSIFKILFQRLFNHAG